MTEEEIKIANELFFIDAKNKSIDEPMRFIFDTNLSNEDINKYERGMLIREKRTFVLNSIHSSFKGNVRFAVYSNHLWDTNIEKFYEGSDDKFYPIANSRYLVLDISKKEQITLITLLHLPDQHLWTAFRERDYLKDAQFIVDHSLKVFNEEMHNPKFEFSKNSRLLGFTNGEKNELDLLVSNDMIPLNELRYRDYSNWGCFYFESNKCNEMIKEYYNLENVKFDGVLACKTIIREEGIVIFPIALCSIVNDRLVSEYLIKDNLAAFSFNDLFDNNSLVFDASDDITDGIEMEDFIELFNYMAENSKATKEVEETRDIVELDPFRYIDHPDIVGVVFCGENKFEILPVMLEGVFKEDSDYIFYGQLLDNSDAIKDLREGDDVDFVLSSVQSPDNDITTALFYIRNHSYIS